MRIVKPPEQEKEHFITCPWCKAELAYTNSDCNWRETLTSHLKYTICPACGQELIVDTIPFYTAIPEKAIPKTLEFWYTAPWWKDGPTCYLYKEQ